MVLIGNVLQLELHAYSFRQDYACAAMLHVSGCKNAAEPIYGGHVTAADTCSTSASALLQCSVATTV